MPSSFQEAACPLHPHKCHPHVQERSAVPLAWALLAASVSLPACRRISRSHGDLETGSSKEEVSGKRVGSCHLWTHLTLLCVTIGSGDLREVPHILCNQGSFQHLQDSTPLWALCVNHSPSLGFWLEGFRRKAKLQRMSLQVLHNPDSSAPTLLQVSDIWTWGYSLWHPMLWMFRPCVWFSLFLGFLSS